MTGCFMHACRMFVCVFWSRVLAGGLELGVQSKGDALKHWFSALKQVNQTHSQWHSLSLDYDPKAKDKGEKKKK